MSRRVQVDLLREVEANASVDGKLALVPAMIAELNDQPMDVDDLRSAVHELMQPPLRADG